MYPFDFVTQQSGFQGCNLTEVNGGAIKTEQDFYDFCEAAAILGTIQAGYTNFPYMTEATKNIFEREALLGVSVTGWMNSPTILFDEKVLRKGAQIVKEVNKKVAKLLGINAAARTTCVKPSGTASIILETESGIHGGHAPRYFRNAQMNKSSEVAQLVRAGNPYMIEDSVWSANGTDWVISYPVIAPEGTIFKKELMGINLLEKVKLVQQVWVEEGTNVDLCVDPRIRHNVSNTVQVNPEDWDEIEAYIFENRFLFSGISFLAASGDKDFAQAPFTEVLTLPEIVDIYGDGSMFASGLIVDGLKVFSNLWRAFDIARDSSGQTQERLDQQIDWIRRYKKFAENYFEGNLKKAEYCLKDVYLLHKWNKVQQNYQVVDFVNNLSAKKFTAVDTLAGAACSGGACEIF
jgi:ribonucleoside-diphosphate reductase alpha chain